MNLFGWSDVSAGDSPPETIAQMMGSAPTQRSLAKLDSAGALAVHGGPGRRDLADDGAIAAAIVGNPRWEEPELAAIAIDSGHAIALGEAYRRYGDGFFRYLHGAFSLAVVARTPRRVLIAVDRFGIFPMCYAQPRGGGLVFGSTTDLVRRHPAMTSTVAAQEIFNYLFFGICPSPTTIYREIFKLLPAQYLVLEQSQLRRAFYWQMPYSGTSTTDDGHLGAEMLALLRGAVQRAVDDHDPATLGAFLSGGLDSSTVVGLLSEAIGSHVKTFTIGFGHGRYDETYYAGITAQHFGAEPHVHYLTPKDVVDVVPRIAQSFDEPYGNSSVIPAYYCAKLARNHGVTRLLAGDGGDELFAGNSRYIDQKIFAVYGAIPQGLRSGLIEPVARVRGFDRWSIGRRARSYIRRALMPMPERLETYNFYRNANLAEVFTAEAFATIDPEVPVAMLREVYERTPSRSMLQRMLHLDLKVTLADNDLRKVGTACELAGVTVAYPFLDEAVAAFSATVPPDLLIKGFQRRWFFRQAVKDLLAPETLKKRKHGFGMPFAEWVREDRHLRDLAVDCMRGFKTRGYLRGEFIDQLIAGGTPEIDDGLAWDIMMLELWFRSRTTGAQPSTNSAADSYY